MSADNHRADPPVVFDEDNPEWTEDDFARARPIEEFPELAAAFAAAKAKRGRPVGSTTSEKMRVTLRVDRDVLEKFKAGGPGWHTRINDALRRAVS